MNHPAGATPNKLRDFFYLGIGMCAGVLVNGYHYGIEDMGIYLPAIKKLIDPALYPYDANFFLLFIRWTTFHQTVAAAVRILHISLESLLFCLQMIGVFFVLLGCLQLVRKCFYQAAAEWCGVALVATFLTMPVAGTYLFLVDQHLHPRTFATAFLLFAAVAVLEKRTIALLWIFLSGPLPPDDGRIWDVPLILSRVARKNCGAIARRLHGHPIWSASKSDLATSNG